MFIATIDKLGGLLRVYHTLRRFEVQFHRPAPKQITFSFVESGQGEFPTWNSGAPLPADPPILSVELKDLTDPKKMDGFRKVFRWWIERDRHNCDLRRMNVLRFRRPDRYTTNLLPDTGTVEFGAVVTPPEAAVATLVEVADCVGHQLLAAGDEKSALAAAILVRRLFAKKDGDLFERDGRWPSRTTHFLQLTAGKLDAKRGKPAQYVWQHLDELSKKLK